MRLDVTGGVSRYREGELVGPADYSGRCRTSGRFAYTTNTGSGSISGYDIDHDGTLTLLNPDGRTADTGVGSAPTDLARSEDGRFLCVRNSAAHGMGAFRVRQNGQLEPVGTIGGLPAGANGLAAR